VYISNQPTMGYSEKQPFEMHVTME